MINHSFCSGQLFGVGFQIQHARSFQHQVGGFNGMAKRNVIQMNANGLCRKPSTNSHSTTSTPAPIIAPRGKREIPIGLIASSD